MSDDIVARIREALGHDTFWDTDAPPLLEDAVAEIERLRAGWIPVSERLPERGGAVLGFLARSTTEGDHDYHMAWRHMDDRPGLRWNGPGEPSHWMPLPKPPEVK
jgi:hypothetical protein